MGLYEHINRILLDGGDPVTPADWERIPPPEMHPDELFEQLRACNELWHDRDGHLSALPLWDIHFAYTLDDRLREVLTDRMRLVTRRAVKLWRRRTGKLVKTTGATVTYFDRCGARRMPDGRVILWLRDRYGHLTLGRQVRLLELDRWLYGGADTQIHDLVRATGWRLTGRYWAIFEPNLNGYTSLLASACCGRNLRKYTRIAVRDIWRLFDPDAIRIAFKCAGSYTTLHACNLIMLDLPGWRRLERETPNLLPLVWLAAVSDQLADPAAPDAVGRLRRLMLDAGLDKAAWKTIAALPAAHILAMARELDWPVMINFVNSLCAIGEIPPYTLFVRWQREFTRQSRQPLPAWFLRAAAREAWQMRRRGRLRLFVRDEYVNTLDWLQTLPAPPDANQQKAGWAWIRRQATAWHQAPQRWGTLIDARWDSLIGECRIDGLIVTPLTSSDALFAEGSEMHHCVAGYAEICVRNQSRIFAVRHPAGNKACRATFEILNMAAFWFVRQVSGYCNNDVPDTVRRVAEEVARRYTAANYMRQTAPPVITEKAPNGPVVQADEDIRFFDGMAQRTAPPEETDFEQNTETHHRPFDARQ